ncbi:hypothetical protein MUY27_02970 [Mucilaginibacter sp. RS28]|uniref:Uncharacterized protein n=1 Tax=Mucilaginibacter straminoryzae TaxID=2932774 RepID=A0A9X2BBU9_9SPHI|nr:hypothetical protein [Mucilaginibacter straminoryzae]MCJ8208653.1 hypothetical protein [Mucilaginibacter straminoryzae]
MNEALFIIRHENGAVTDILDYDGGVILIAGTVIVDTLARAKTMLETIGVNCTLIDEQIENNF